MKPKSLTGLVGWEAFLHGVFAIAITLLVLDMRVPQLDDMANGDALIDALLHGWPRYLAYALGFMYIGTYWLATNRTLRLLRGVDHWFLVLGLLYLMQISAVPFVTGLLAEYIQQGNGRDKVAVIVFTGWMLLLSIMANVTLQYAAYKHRLLKPGLDKAALKAWTRLGALGPLIWLAALVAALILNGTISLILDIGILILFLQEVPIGDGETAEPSATV